MADEIIESSATTEPITEPAPTLAEHRAEFPTPTGRRPPPVDPSAPPPEPAAAAPKPDDRVRHRAKSQQARAEDSPRIKELTRKQKESDDRAARLESELAALKATPTQPVAAAPVVPPTTEPVAAVTTATKKPDPSDLTKYPYGSADPQFIEDTADWKFETRSAEREADARTKQETADAETQKVEGRKRFTTNWNKAKADIGATFEEIAKRPTLWPVGTGHPIDLWIWTRPDGPKVLWFLNDPANIAETQRIMALPTPDDQVVALALLEQRFHTPPLDGVTGAPAAVTLEPSPRPPTPVRTGPMRPSDTPPGPGSSLREHQRYYPQTRRR